MFDLATLPSWPDAVHTTIGLLQRAVQNKDYALLKDLLALLTFLSLDNPPAEAKDMQRILDTFFSLVPETTPLNSPTLDTAVTYLTGTFEPAWKAWYTAHLPF